MAELHEPFEHNARLGETARVWVADWLDQRAKGLRDTGPDRDPTDWALRLVRATELERARDEIRTEVTGDV